MEFATSWSEATPFTKVAFCTSQKAGTWFWIKSWSTSPSDVGRGGCRERRISIPPSCLPRRGRGCGKWQEMSMVICLFKFWSNELSKRKSGGCSVFLLEVYWVNWCYLQSILFPGCVLVIICSLLIFFTDKDVAKYIDPIMSLVSVAFIMVLSYPYSKWRYYISFLYA